MTENRVVYWLYQAGRWLFWGGVTLVTFALGLLTLAGFGGEYHWALDALSNFRLYYFVALLLLLGLAWWGKKWWLFAPVLLLAGVNGGFLLPYYGVTTAVSAAPPTTEPLRLLMANVYYYNEEPEALVAYITEQDPDIIVLVEMTSRLKGSIRPLYEAYPYQVDGYGQENIILSRVPIRQSWYEQHGTRRPNAIAQFTWQGQPFTVIGTHPSTPLSQRQMSQRTRTLGLLAETSRAISPQEGVIIAGDLNTTPFSPHFQTLLREGGCRMGGMGLACIIVGRGKFRFCGYRLTIFYTRPWLK
jgi:endonuclease/exonuclease/phosphatase (EEP) superfamily protein YafD